MGASTTLGGRNPLFLMSLLAVIAIVLLLPGRDLSCSESRINAAKTGVTVLQHASAAIDAETVTVQIAITNACGTFSAFTGCDPLLRGAAGSA